MSDLGDDPLWYDHQEPDTNPSRWLQGLAVVFFVVQSIAGLLRNFLKMFCKTSRNLGFKDL